MTPVQRLTGDFITSSEMGHRKKLGTVTCNSFPPPPLLLPDVELVQGVPHAVREGPEPGSGEPPVLHGLQLRPGDRKSVV